MPLSASKRILLVDDSPQDVEMTLEALAEENADKDVVALRDGAEALDYLFRRGEFASRPAGNPAVVLLDLKMPKVDGMEVLRQLKNDPQLKLIPVVVLTSSREEKDVAGCYQLGANAYAVKPAKFHEFVEMVKHLVAFWTRANELPPAVGRKVAPGGESES
jgi:two-component system, response regulator